MQKDVIYIDVEDDITAIIGKVKSSKEKVVALVPPKRIGVLQSAVNLRLLARTAEQGHKHLVLIAHNPALLALASSAKIPVAKNLQSKPEIAEIPALEIDDGEDVIDGEQLPVGDLARTTAAGRAAAASGSLISGINIDDDTPKATPPVAGAKPSKPRTKSGIKVPSFNDFRKRLFIFGGLGVLLIGFLIWAIWFAPRATVIVSARTTPSQVRTQVALGPALATDSEAATIKSVAQQDKKTDAIEFDATGTKDVGEKAKGTVRFTTDSYTALLQGITISAGTALTSTSGKVFYTDRTVQLSIGSGNSDSTGVTAAEMGESYNAASGAVSGAPSGVEAGFTGSTAGGTQKTIKIVTAADVQKATQQLSEQNKDEIKNGLKAKFAKDVIIIDDSFVSDDASPKASPDVGQEATGKAKLISDVTYTMTGISKSELSNFLRSAIEKELVSGNEQRVYDDGASSAKLANFKKTGETSSVNIDATGQVGPKIDDNAIKEQVKGKRYGEVQSQLKEIEGVSDADTKFWPFWVRTVPNDVKKIKIEFKLQNASDS